jgi:RNA polymerase primary sigma factor
MIDKQKERNMIMGLQEKKQIIRELSVQGMAQSRISTTEILDALGDQDFDAEQMERLYDTLKGLGIEIVEDIGAQSDPWTIVEKDGAGCSEAVQIYLKAVCEVPPVLPEEEKELLRRIRKKDTDAARRLAEGHLRLVVLVASRYQHRGLHLLDLIQEGNLGLIKAKENLGQADEYSFATRAVWWIRQNILRAIAEQTRPSRIPAAMLECARKVRVVSEQLFQNTGREPTVMEIAAALELPEEKIRAIQRMMQDTVPLDTLIADEENHTGEYVGDFDVQEKADPASDTQATKNRVLEAMQKMSPREQKVICLRFGLNGERPHTLEEVAGLLNVTRERVRQLECKALWKARPRAHRRKRLKDFLD